MLLTSRMGPYKSSSSLVATTLVWLVYSTGGLLRDSLRSICLGGVSTGWVVMSNSRLCGPHREPAFPREDYGAKPSHWLYVSVPGAGRDQGTKNKLLDAHKGIHTEVQEVQASRPLRSKCNSRPLRPASFSVLESRGAPVLTSGWDCGK
ncbi:uncharacterized protein LAESUDRAFT_721911 [Laetiporus sulphureus 93-53]|uniref:Uncharacterized protein n=1 Tax=Laetiporus sulphureus 93-53 TaxID=1314785 RepID=A0A165GLT8_9APHY|nr:uncharacterized protein LAESUDRAFT_721911 [Laetiporus sulphureus 93-53]KZT10528.1 hypothetical protein LAESUDRAFT_721911 [Laetiporus sulphureus 93-53]